MFAGCLSRFGKNASRWRGGEDQNFGVDFHLQHFFLYIHPSDLLLGWGRNGGMSTFEIEELRQGEKDLFSKRRAITFGGFRTLRGGERARSTCRPESTTTHLLISSPTRVTSVKSQKSQPAHTCSANFFFSGSLSKSLHQKSLRS